MAQKNVEKALLAKIKELEKKDLIIKELSFCLKEFLISTNDKEGNLFTAHELSKSTLSKFDIK